MLATLEVYNDELDTGIKKDLSKHYYCIQGGLGFKENRKTIRRLSCRCLFSYTTSWRCTTAWFNWYG